MLSDRNISHHFVKSKIIPVIVMRRLVEVSGQPPICEEKQKEKF